MDGPTDAEKLPVTVRAVGLISTLADRVVERRSLRPRDDRAGGRRFNFPVFQPFLRGSIRSISGLQRDEGYADALASFVESAALSPSARAEELEGEHPASESVSAMQTRSEIRQLILDGEVKAARQRCDECFPSLLESRPLALAELLCQEFIELIITLSKPMNSWTVGNIFKN